MVGRGPRRGRSVLSSDVVGRPGRRGRLHRPVGEHGAGRRGRRAGRPLPDVDRHPGRALLPRGHRRPAAGYAPLAAARPGSAAPAGSRRRRRRPGRPHAAPRARRARGGSGGALVPRAGRLPDDALHRQGRGHPRVDERRLADRQPPPRPAGLRPDARAPRRRRRDPSCRRWSRPDRSSGRCSPRSRPSSESPRARRSSPAARTCTPRRSAPARCDEGEPHLTDQHHLVDHAPGPVQEDRRDPPDRHRPRAGLEPLPRGQQPGDGRPLPALAAERLPHGRAGELRAADRAGGDGAARLRTA